MTDKSKERCASCGYTEEDQRTNGDHHRCVNAGNAPWELRPDQASEGATPAKHIKSCNYERWRSLSPSCPGCGEVLDRMKATVPPSSPEEMDAQKFFYANEKAFPPMERWLDVPVVFKFAEAYAALREAPLREQIKESEEGRKHTQDWYAGHYGKLQDWARKRLPDPWRTEFFNCVANGTWGFDDVGEPYMSVGAGRIVPSGYFKMETAAEQLLHDQTTRAEVAEERVRMLEEIMRDLIRKECPHCWGEVLAVFHEVSGRWIHRERGEFICLLSRETRKALAVLDPKGASRKEQV